MLFVTQTRIYFILVVLFWGSESLDRHYLNRRKNSNVTETRLYNFAAAIRKDKKVDKFRCFNKSTKN